MQRPYEVQLGRKQQASQQRFLEVWAGIGDLVPEWWIDYLIATCATEVRETVRGKRAALPEKF